MFMIDFRQTRECRGRYYESRDRSWTAAGRWWKIFSPEPPRLPSSKVLSVFVLRRETRSYTDYRENRYGVAASIFGFARSNSRWIAAYPSARDAAESPPMDLTLDRATVTSRPITRLASDLAITVTYRAIGLSGDKGTCQRGPFYPERISRAD